MPGEESRLPLVESPDHILDSLSAYLRHEREEGRLRVAVSAETLACLRGKPAPRTAAARPAAVATPPAREINSGSAAEQLSRIAERIAACTACPLCESRTQTVPGQGHAGAEIAFVGEGPGFDEDQQGLAFVGKAGQLLSRMIAAMGLSREDVWIGNVVKCRPPDNRTPMDHEMQACLPFLKEQLEALQPSVIVCLGSTAVKGLLDTSTGITRLRGQWMRFNGIDVMPTFHPAYLLRNPAAKKDAWEDLKSVLTHLGKPVPDHTRK